MSESKKETEWRDIWQEIIETSRKVLRNKLEISEGFKALNEKYPADKMLVFEKGIAAECLTKKEIAIDFYTQAADDTNGLPVSHWKKRAKYFLDRIITRGCSVTTDLNPNDTLFEIQWNTYFNIHSFANIDEYLCYLAISSVSRSHSEPAMAAVIFRTCLEIGLWSYYESDVNKINQDWKRQNMKDRKYKDIGLDDLLRELKNRKVIKTTEYEVFDKIRYEGNLAAHPKIIIKNKKPFKYTDPEIVEILFAFNKTMQILNDQAEKKVSLR